jgi:hypothetical protein
MSAGFRFSFRIHILLLVISASLLNNAVLARRSRVKRPDRRNPQQPLTGATAMGEAAQFMKIDRRWSIPPLDCDTIRSSLLARENRALSEYIASVLGSAPLVVHLDSKPVQVKHTEASHSPTTVRKYKASVTLGSQSPLKKAFLTPGPKALRSVWSTVSPEKVDNSKDLLTKTFEQAAMSTRNLLEIEIILPKTKAVPSSPAILYTFPIEAGSMSKASRLALTRGRVQVFPRGRKHINMSTTSASPDMQQSMHESSETSSRLSFDVGVSSLHLHSGPPLIDWTWAKGKTIFWKGRSVGQV